MLCEIKPKQRKRSTSISARKNAQRSYLEMAGRASKERATSFGGLDRQFLVVVPFSPLPLSLSLARLPAATSRCDIGFYRRKVGASAPLCPRHFLLHGKTTVGSSVVQLISQEKRYTHTDTHTKQQFCQFLGLFCRFKTQTQRGGWRRSMYGKSPISPARLEE